MIITFIQEVNFNRKCLQKCPEKHHFITNAHLPLPPQKRMRCVTFSTCIYSQQMYTYITELFARIRIKQCSYVQLINVNLLIFTFREDPVPHHTSNIPPLRKDLLQETQEINVLVNACLIIFLFINEISLLLIRVSYESLLVFLLLLLLLQRAYLHTFWKCSTCNSAARLAIAAFTQSLCDFTNFFLFLLFACGAKPH